MAPQSTSTSEAPPSGATGTGDENRPSGPTGWEWFKLYTRFMIASDPLDVFTELAREHAPLARFQQPRIDVDVYVMTRPENIEHVLLRNPERYIRPTGNAGGGNLDYVLGQGLLTSQGELWERQHRLIAPMFHRKSVRGFAELMLRETRRMVDRWAPSARAEEPLNLLEEMKRITLLVIAKSLFSADVEEHVSTVRDALRTFRANNTRGIWELLRPPFWVPTPRNQRIKRAKENLDEIVYGLIEDRRGHEEEYEDFLSMLMLAEDEETGERMDTEQIRDEVMTFFLAGHETTANALTWTWFLLGRHPEVHRRAHEEAVRHPMDDGFDREAYGNLTFIERVIKESMRVYSPVPITARMATEDDQLAGHHIPAGSIMITSPYVVHRLPELWEEPMRFEPDRFKPENEKQHERFAYFPFGGGRRICTGREFAKMEARLILSQTLRHYRLELQDPETAPGRDSAVTMEPGRPLNVIPRTW